MELLNIDTIKNQRVLLRIKESIIPNVDILFEYIFDTKTQEGYWQYNFVAPSYIDVVDLEAYLQLLDGLIEDLNYNPFDKDLEFEYWRFIQDSLSTFQPTLVFSKMLSMEGKMENNKKKLNWFKKIIDWLVHNWKIVIGVVISILLLLWGKDKYLDGDKTEKLIHNEIKKKEDEIKEIDKQVSKREKEIEDVKQEKEDLVSNTKKEIEQIDKDLKRVDKALERVYGKEKNQPSEEKTVDEAIDHINKVVIGK